MQHEELVFRHELLIFPGAALCCIDVSGRSRATADCVGGGDRDLVWHGSQLVVYPSRIVLDLSGAHNGCH